MERPLSTTNKDLLLSELRRFIDEASAEKSNEIISLFERGNSQFSKEEIEDKVEELLQQGFSNVIFQFFAIIDGVADPTDGEKLGWTEVALVDRKVIGDVDVDFLHDEAF